MKQDYETAIKTRAAFRELAIAEAKKGADDADRILFQTGLATEDEIRLIRARSALARLVVAMWRTRKVMRKLDDEKAVKLSTILLADLMHIKHEIERKVP